jgi:hypothetical protein
LFLSFQAIIPIFPRSVSTPKWTSFRVCSLPLCYGMRAVWRRRRREFLQFREHHGPTRAASSARAPEHLQPQRPGILAVVQIEGKPGRVVSRWYQMGVISEGARHRATGALVSEAGFGSHQSISDSNRGSNRLRPNAPLPEDSMSCASMSTASSPRPALRCVALVPGPSGTGTSSPRRPRRRRPTATPTR